MNQIVADASFCGAWILADEVSEKADLLLSQIVAGAVGLVVPGLWHYEMSNMLRSAVLRKRLSREDAGAALEGLENVPVILEDLPDSIARKRILYLALQFDLSSYDAAYLELADRLKVPLFSSDAKLTAAASGLTADYSEEVSLLGCLSGKVQVKGDITEPTTSANDWSPSL